jgi:ComF family protein
MLSETIKKRYANQLLPDLLLPVPLHYKRIAERGFNQALEIARIIAKSLQIPIDAKSCIRVRNTAAQAELKSDKRKANVARAFQCIKPIAAKHVAIVDDVVTTGNTVRELSKVLHKAGVERIDVWCIARA